MEAGKIFNCQTIKKIPFDIQRTAKKKLNILDAALSLNALKCFASDGNGISLIEISYT